MDTRYPARGDHGNRIFLIEPNKLNSKSIRTKETKGLGNEGNYWFSENNKITHLLCYGSLNQSTFQKKMLWPTLYEIDSTDMICDAKLMCAKYDHWHKKRDNNNKEFLTYEQDMKLFYIFAI